MTVDNRSESAPPGQGAWHRRILHAPPSAAWVPGAVEKLSDVSALPPLRGLHAHPDGTWSVEEYFDPALTPLGGYLSSSSASVWVFVSIVQQCLAGLEGLHTCGLQHGALVPATIVIDTSGEVRLIACGGGNAAPDWAHTPLDVPTPPQLHHALAAADLRDLGRVFREVLGGTPDERIAVTRPDIAPLLAEWIDWLVEPPEGKEPASASQAAAIFDDIRAGRAGVRPWQTKSELPPELLDGDASRELTAAERKALRKAARTAHGSGLELRGLVILGLIILAVLAGGAWFLNRFLEDKKKAQAAQDLSIQLPEQGIEKEMPKLPADLLDVFEATGGDINPLPETEGMIKGLLDALKDQMPPPGMWEAELEKQKAERAAGLKADENDPAGVPGDVAGKAARFLFELRIFPAIGTPSPGRGPGDFYLVWRTNRLVLTPEECRALQSAVLRTARYCGVRLMAWTVLPNQVGVVLRVLPPQPLSDEVLQRRIAILRGEASAAKTMAQINEKLKAGDAAGAAQMRRLWTASMGSAAGFYSVVKTVPIVDPAVLRGHVLWESKPHLLTQLHPDKPELIQAASALDMAAVSGRLVEVASAWPLCGLKAAMINYGPALRAISVLMQKNPQASLPVPPLEELNNALRAYRRFLKDLPPAAEPSPLGDPAAPAAKPAPAPPQPVAPASAGAR